MDSLIGAVKIGFAVMAFFLFQILQSLEHLLVDASGNKYLEEIKSELSALGPFGEFYKQRTHLEGIEKVLEETQTTIQSRLEKIVEDIEKLIRLKQFGGSSL